MTSRRVLKVAQAIREVVSMAILADLKDPRISDVTVTYVEVTPDIRQAKVHVSVMGDETKQALCLHGLRSSAGYLQSKIGNRIDTRYIPRLSFELDEGVKKSIEITKILNEVLAEDEKRRIERGTESKSPPGSGRESPPSETPAPEAQGLERTEDPSE